MRQILFACTFCAGCFTPPGCDETPQSMTYHPPDFAGADLAVAPDLAPPCNARCNGQCVNLFDDPDNCGACGIQCPSGVCEVNDGGVPFCTCTPDGGSQCSFALDPQCSAGGHCTCGGDESGVCDTDRASQCKNGSCMCGESEPVCDSLADHCDPSLTPSCRCGGNPRCDSNKANRCDGASCKCGQHDACGPTSFCCGNDVGGATCCDDAKYCCLDGCCDHPCLVLGFCAQ